MLPIGVLSLTLGQHVRGKAPGAQDAKRKKSARQGIKVDYIGFILVALFLGCLEVTLDRGPGVVWFSSSMVVASSRADLGTRVHLTFIPWELKRGDPIVNIKLFANRNFVIANIFMLLMGLIVFGTTQFIPQLLQEVLGYTATNAGLALTMGGLATSAGDAAGRVSCLAAPIPACWSVSR